MFEIALTVLSCLKAGTRADVTWVADYEGTDIAGKNGAIVLEGNAAVGAPTGSHTIASEPRGIAVLESGQICFN